MKSFCRMQNLTKASTSLNSAHQEQLNATSYGASVQSLGIFYGIFKICKMRVIFLGTPEVAAAALRRIAASPLTSVVGVVTQPPRPAGRRRALHPSAVQKEAESLGLRVLTPSRIAGDETFLATLLEEELRPDLCVTMAFGQILPNAFLRVPTVGTINIHPSLLPDLRGAAPVQRALERGDESAGVSVLTTVRALDAGPILAQGRVDVGEGEQAPELLERLVNEGTSLLLDEVVPALLAAVSLVFLCIDD